jgi:hypothetical protein
MPYSTSSISCDSQIKSHWPSKYMPITADTNKFIASISAAFRQSMTITLKSVVINGGSISGGAAPSGGPVTGAVLSFPAKSITSTPPDFELVYVPPIYSNDMGPGSHTVWMKHLIADLSKGLKQAWVSWSSSWSLPAGVAYGGVAAWIPSTPPSAGPWSAGTIKPFTFLGEGVSASTDLVTFDKIIASIASPDSVTPNDTQPCQVYNQYSKDIIDAITLGMSDALKLVLSQILAKDPTGSSASGTAMPGGSILPGMISGVVLDIS